MTGFTLSNNGCTQCQVAGCSKCDKAANCTLCNTGYYLSGNACLLCSVDCATCSNANGCDTCKAGNQLKVVVDYYLRETAAFRAKILDASTLIL
jgi:Giardia variant-specific surface protein